MDFDTESVAGRPYIVTQPTLNSNGQQENPIVFVDLWFLKFTGYEIHEMLGRNCNFLQERPSVYIPPEDVTEEEEQMMSEQAKVTVKRIAESGTAEVVSVVNYTKDGKPFRNTFMIDAHRDRNNSTVNFFVAKNIKIEYLFKDKCRGIRSNTPHVPRLIPSFKMRDEAEIFYFT
jgi:hypothetical protein